MYTCTICGHASSTKLGKCPSCGEFATFEQDPSGKYTKKSAGQTINHASSTSLEIITYPLSMTELQRVLGPSIQGAGVYLLGGEPGIGKSTLVLQLLADIITSTPDITTGYISAEEHPSHVAARRSRVLPDTSMTTQIYHSSRVEDIISTMQHTDHQLMIVDSIQTVHSSSSDSTAGSATQVRACSEALVAAAKSTHTTLIIIGHVTKGGEIAGPKYLEHIVDVVLYLEGEESSQLRFLRGQKNRFGPTHDTGIFDMTLFGLQPVYDLHTRILESVHSGVPGSALTIALDNGRPVLIAIEVLLNKTSGKYPLRRCIGVDAKRVDMIIAILEKYCQCKLSFVDIYLNIPGEFRFADAGMDVAIAAAILSQYHSKPLSSSTVYLGELGLTGHLSSTKAHTKRTATIADTELSLIDHATYSHIIQLAKDI